MLSYLVFFKALTKVVSNFNAASAGFNFEAFLAVLLDGQQVPANTGTIADFTTGDQIPISLKLYNEKSVVVGGSFNDLVGDLVQPQFSGFSGMRYVVCMKSFTSSETGEKQGSGLDIEGDIKFFQFDFTLDNIADIIARSMDKSKICIQLPAAFVASGGERNVANELPGASMPSAQDLEDMFIGFFKQEIVSALEGGEIELNDGQVDAFLNKLEWSKRDSLFAPVGKGDVQKMVVRGQSGIVQKTGNSEVKAIVDELAEDGVFGSSEENPRGFAKAVKTLKRSFGKATDRANDKVRAEFATARVKSERNRMLKQPGFYASLEDSVTFYNSLKGNPEAQKLALLNSRGMLETHQFDVNRKQVLEISQDLGVIKIGARIVQEMLNKMTQDLNEAIFDIFTNVKIIQDNTYGFMASGLQDDEKAKASIKASNAIAYKTEELRPEKINESEGDDKMKLSDWDRGNSWRPDIFANKSRKQTKKVVDALQQLTRDVFVGPDSQPQNLPGGIPKNFENMANGTTVAAKYKPEDKEKIKELLSKVSLPPPIKKYSYYFGKAMSQQIELPMTSRENTSLVMVWVYKEKNQEMKFPPTSIQGDSIQ